MKYYTDYPLIELGDVAGFQAPIREIEILQYDGDKHCKVKHDETEEWIKTGYIYTEKRRFKSGVKSNIDFSIFRI